MTRFPVSTSSEQSIYAALERSKNSCLLSIQVPGRDSPSLYPIRSGNAEGLMAKLDAARGPRGPGHGSDAEPDSAPSKWFHHRAQGRKGRIRRVMIVALARKLAIAFLRYLETGPIPEGAVVK